MRKVDVRRGLKNLWIDLEYGWLLPWMAKLPLQWAYRFSDWRGRCNARHARDWTELALEMAYVGERSAQAYRFICPECTESEIRSLVTQRYQAVAREELDGALTIAGRLDEIEMDAAPLHNVLAQRAAGRGLVVVMSHHDSFFMAMMLLASTGCVAHLMISDIVFDDRVHPRLRAFTRKKYDAFVARLNGGQFLSASAKNHAFFKAALRRGEVLMVVTDTPADRADEKGTWVSWLGKRRKMADGAVRIALETDSQLLAMHTRHERAGLQRWTSSALVDPRDFSALQGVQLREAVFAPLVQFLENVVRKDPGRWSAAHLLGEFGCDPEDVHAN